MARNNGMGGHGPSTSFERPKEGSGKVLRRLWSYLRHYRWLLFFAAVLSVTSNLLALVGPKLSGYAIDAIRPGAGGVDFETVFYYAGLMLVFYLLSSVLSYLLASILVRLARNVVYRLRRDIYDHLMQLPVRFFDTHSVGDVL